MPDLVGIGAYAQSAAAINYTYNDTDDLWSLRHWLVRNISPSMASGAGTYPQPGEAYVYVEPIIGTFDRDPGAITITLASGMPHTPWPARDPSSFHAQQIAFRVYANTRADTMALSEKVMGALGARGGDNLRIPMAAFWVPASAVGVPTPPQLAFRLGRFLRVQRNSIAPSLEEPDDDRLWSRTIQARITSPRNRAVETLPIVRKIVFGLHGGG